MSTYAAELEKQPKPSDPAVVPPIVKKRLERGRARMRKNSVPRRLNYKFWRGDEYWYINSKNLLVNQGTLSWLMGGASRTTASATSTRSSR
jgi:hypothetical protein